MKETRLNEFCTVVFEVSSFVGNPVVSQIIELGMIQLSEYYV